MTKTQKNGKIEVLRFIFAVIIVLHHSRNLVGDDKCLFLGGSLAVEFFFIVSGYLMLASIEKIQRVKPCTDELGKETAGFLLRKLRGLYPEIIITWLFAFGFIQVVSKSGLREICEEFLLHFWEMFLLSMTGIGKTGTNGVVWYISSMLLCMALLYPLIRKWPDMMLNLVVPAAMLLSFGYLFQTFGAPRNPQVWIGFMYKGTLRGFAEICLGIICYRVAKWYKDVPLSVVGGALSNIVEALLYIAVILYMYFEKATSIDYAFILLLAVAITLSFSGQGAVSGLFNNEICYFLGKFSVPLYLSHLFYAHYLGKLIPDIESVSERMRIYLIIVLITSILVMLISKGIRKYFAAFQNMAASILLDKRAV